MISTSKNIEALKIVFAATAYQVCDCLCNTDALCKKDERGEWHGIISLY